MDALHPRLVVDRFGECFRFYDGALTQLAGATLARGSADGPYASWDVGSEGVLALLDAALPTPDVAEAGAPGPSRVVLVSRVPDVPAAWDLCLRLGGEPVAEPVERTELAAGFWTALVRDPAGNLLELQAY
jgi:hypothetical protein